LPDGSKDAKEWILVTRPLGAALALPPSFFVSLLVAAAAVASCCDPKLAGTETSADATSV
jgi:hypothetical protein